MLKVLRINKTTYGKEYAEENVTQDRDERNSNLCKEEKNSTDTEKECPVWSGWGVRQQTVIDERGKCLKKRMWP